MKTKIKIVCTNAALETFGDIALYLYLDNVGRHLVGEGSRLENRLHPLTLALQLKVMVSVPGSESGF